MNLPLLAIFAACSMAVALSGYWLFVSIPRARTSIFRYQLWKLRDAAVDEILTGQRADTPELREFIIHVELSIRIAKVLSPLRLALLLLLVSKMRRTAGKGDRPIPAATRGEFDKLYGQLAIRHLLTGSPSGWACWLILHGIMKPLARVSGRARQLLRKLYAVAVDMTGMIPPGTSGSEGSLSACM